MQERQEAVLNIMIHHSRMTVNFRHCHVHEAIRRSFFSLIGIEIIIIGAATAVLHTRLLAASERVPWKAQMPSLTGQIRWSAMGVLGACSHSRRVDWIADEAGRQRDDKGGMDGRQYGGKEPAG